MVYWRAGCEESRKSGSEGGGWKRSGPLARNLADRLPYKTDVGSPSEQPDDGDRLKAAFSDALKRAAIKLGIGRYLYRLPRQWVDYDPQSKQFAKTPMLPAWALPQAKQSA